MSTPEHPSPTRGEILRLIRLHGGMTARQLAEALDITSMGVRRHLMTLERDGLVLVQAQRQPAGRPTFIYRLSDAAYDIFPQKYVNLALDLLEAAQNMGGEDAVAQLLSSRREQLHIMYGPRLTGRTLAERVQQMTAIQQENGYMASCEETDDGFVIRQHNCAIYRVACRFGATCQYELDLFRRLLDADVTRIEHQFNGEPACTFLFQSKNGNGHRPPPHARSTSRSRQKK